MDPPFSWPMHWSRKVYTFFTVVLEGKHQRLDITSAKPTWIAAEHTQRTGQGSKHYAHFAAVTSLTNMPSHKIDKLVAAVLAEKHSPRRGQRPNAQCQLFDQRQ